MSSGFSLASLPTVCGLVASLFLAPHLYNWLSRLRSGLHPTRLQGPPRRSLFRGYLQDYALSEDGSLLYESWESQYGSVFQIPWVLGATRVVLADPKAISHFYSHETFTYVQSQLTRDFVATVFGKGILWSEGEDHKRQRKALTPAFSNAAIRRITSVFFDSAYKLQNVWDAMIEAGPDDHIILDVQKWMNRVALDSMGIAGFSHDFRSLDSTSPLVERAFDDLLEQGGRSGLVSPLTFLLSPLIPFILKFVMHSDSPGVRLRRNLEEVADDLLERTRAGSSEADKSIIGLLIKAETTDKELFMTQPEIVAQNVLLVAGYITTSASLTWALIELSRNEGAQSKLRQELQDHFTRHSSDPSYEQLQSPTALPFLDAVVHEVLRIHPPLPETNRVASQDDVIPLLHPITTRDGKVVENVILKKGQDVAVPIRFVGRSEKFWGPDAKQFKPERWTEMANGEKSGGKLGAYDISGYRHLLTFSDGPRTCLGKGFALIEFKAVLAVILRNYSFEFPDGPGTKIVSHRSLLARPKVEGFKSPEVPLKIRRVT